MSSNNGGAATSSTYSLTPSAAPESTHGFGVKKRNFLLKRKRHCLVHLRISLPLDELQNVFDDEIRKFDVAPLAVKRRRLFVFLESVLLLFLFCLFDEEGCWGDARGAAVFVAARILDDNRIVAIRLRHCTNGVQSFLGALSQEQNILFICQRHKRKNLSHP